MSKFVVLLTVYAAAVASFLLYDHLEQKRQSQADVGTQPERDVAARVEAVGPLEIGVRLAVPDALADVGLRAGWRLSPGERFAGVGEDQEKGDQENRRRSHVSGERVGPKGGCCRGG